MRGLPSDPRGRPPTPGAAPHKVADTIGKAGERYLHAARSLHNHLVRAWPTAQPASGGRRHSQRLIDRHRAQGYAGRAPLGVELAADYLIAEADDDVRAGAASHLGMASAVEIWHRARRVVRVVGKQA